MRFPECSRGSAPNRLALSVRQTFVAVTFVGLALAGCSSNSPTAPTTHQNLVLMARFDSVLGTLDPDVQARRREQFSEVITLLAFGAPVQTVQLSVNGTAQPYSAVGGFIVSDDIEGNPSDSAYTLLLWRGDAADTLASVVTFDGLSAFELTDSSTHVGSTGQASGAAQAAAPHASCTSFLDHLPPDVSVPSGLTCQLESVTVSASGDTDAPGTFALGAQMVTSVRVDGQTGS